MYIVNVHATEEGVMMMMGTGRYVQEREEMKKKRDLVVFSPSRVVYPGCHDSGRYVLVV
jgi:hypothetical protein